MSHLPERKEKVCLNCGAALHGRFCHYCGQENIEPKETFWHLVTHFVYDLVHFDGKFFSTLKYLLFKPGFLSYEHLRGRRANYLHPIRLYVFTSAFFFLIFFGFYQKSDDITIEVQPRPTAAKTLKNLHKQDSSLTKALGEITNPITKQMLETKIKATRDDIRLVEADSTMIDSLLSINTAKQMLVTDADFALIFGRNQQEYDSIQASLPKSHRHGWFRRLVAHQCYHLSEKYKGDQTAMFQAITNKFKHMFPQMFFVSLPLFALVLQLLYVRREQFYYVNHVIYSIHLYCAIFIIILSWLWVRSLLGYVGLSAIRGWTGFIFTLATFFYLYKSMRNFYVQKRAKTILKYIILLMATMGIMLIIFSVFMLISALIL